MKIGPNFWDFKDLIGGAIMHAVPLTRSAIDHNTMLMIMSLRRQSVIKITPKDSKEFYVYSRSELKEATNKLFSEFDYEFVRIKSDVIPNVSLDTLKTVLTVWEFEDLSRDGFCLTCPDTGATFAVTDFIKELAAA